MSFVGDFHIHSRYSRATSRNLTLEELDKYAAKKGVDVLGTGDFTHPLWLKELEEELEEAEPGLYIRKGSEYGTRFLLTSEVASIYSKGGYVRKVHTLLFAPSLAVVREINKKLGKVGNLHSDGRPILGLDVKELAKIAFDVSEECMVVPAHAWTPWFSVFGSKSGFNSLEECFEEMTPHIFAIETGLSSDPPMNWRINSLDNITLISNSDAHSAAKIAREANVFNCDMSYSAIHDTLKRKDPERFLYTIEFFPEEGKYHYDGHRMCNFRTRPEDRENELCPECKRQLTVGVLSRVNDLASRPEGEKPGTTIPYKSLIPLCEVLAEVLEVGPKSKTVAWEHDKLIDAFGTELNVLLTTPLDDIIKVSGNVVSEAVRKVRDGDIHINPGYDGEYGSIYIFTEEERRGLNSNTGQRSLL